MTDPRRRLSDGGWEIIKIAIAVTFALGAAVGTELFVGNDSSDLTCDHIVQPGGAVPMAEMSDLHRRAVDACYEDLIDELSGDD